MKRYVRAMVLDAKDSQAQLHRGDLVTVDLQSSNELASRGGLLYIKEFDNYRYADRFAIDPILGRK